MALKKMPDQKKTSKSFKSFMDFLKREATSEQFRERVKIAELQPHIDEQTMQAYVLGKLCREERNHVMDHIFYCRKCSKNALHTRRIQEEKGKLKRPSVVRDDRIKSPDHEAVKKQIYDVLIRQVKQTLIRRDKRENIIPEDAFISYAEVANAVSLAQLQPSDSRLHAFLNEISTEEAKAGRGMLTAIVINKKQKRPGPGFFNLARKLGKIYRGASEADKDKFWEEECEKVFKYWAKIFK